MMVNRPLGLLCTSWPVRGFVERRQRWNEEKREEHDELKINISRDLLKVGLNYLQIIEFTSNSSPPLTNHVLRFIFNSSPCHHSPLSSSLLPSPSPFHQTTNGSQRGAMRWIEGPSDGLPSFGFRYLFFFGYVFFTDYNYCHYHGNGNSSSSGGSNFHTVTNHRAGRVGTGSGFRGRKWAQTTQDMSFGPFVSFLYISFMFYYY